MFIKKWYYFLSKKKQRTFEIYEVKLDNSSEKPFLFGINMRDKDIMKIKIYDHHNPDTLKQKMYLVFFYLDFIQEIS